MTKRCSDQGILENGLRVPIYVDAKARPAGWRCPSQGAAPCELFNSAINKKKSPREGEHKGLEDSRAEVTQWGFS